MLNNFDSFTLIVSLNVITAVISRTINEIFCITKELFFLKTPNINRNIIDKERKISGNTNGSHFNINDEVFELITNIEESIEEDKDMIDSHKKKMENQKKEFERKDKELEEKLDKEQEEIFKKES